MQTLCDPLALIPRMRRILMVLLLVLVFGCAGSGGAASPLKAWKKDVRRGIQACEAHVELKSSAEAEDSEVDASKAALLGQLDALVLEAFSNHSSDFKFMDFFMRTVLPNEGGKNMQSRDGQSMGTLAESSKLIKVCYGVLEARCTWGRFYDQLSRLPGCIKNSETASESDGRCFPKRVGEAMDAFQYCGDTEEMLRVFKEASEMRGSGGAPLLLWGSNPMMRAPMTFTGLRNKAIWHRGDGDRISRVMDVLESNVPVFRRELEALKATGFFQDSFMRSRYDHILHGGTWSKVNLFYGNWNETVCSTTPRTCKLLQKVLRNEFEDSFLAQEEVMFFHGSPHLHVLPHTGGTNARINIHIGLEGYEGSELIVHTGAHATESLRWSDTSAIAFNDGFIHEVVNGPHHRYALCISIMHPDVSAESIAATQEVSTAPVRKKTKKKRRKDHALPVELSKDAYEKAQESFLYEEL